MAALGAIDPGCSGYKSLFALDARVTVALGAGVIMLWVKESLVALGARVWLLWVQEWLLWVQDNLVAMGARI